VETLQELLNEKSRMNDRDVREYKREKQQQDLRMASMMDEINALKSNQSRKVNENNSEVNTLKGNTKKIESILFFNLTVIIEY